MLWRHRPSTLSDRLDPRHHFVEFSTLNSLLIQIHKKKTTIQKITVSSHWQKSRVKVLETSEQCIPRPKLPIIMCEYDVMGYFDPKNGRIKNS